MIIAVFMVMFSIMTSSYSKGLIYFMWVILILFFRILILYGKIPNPQLPTICQTGLTQLWIPQDVTFSTFFLTFTMVYLLLPIVLLSKQNKINAVNYGVFAFFSAYILFDLFIKSSLSCISSLFTTQVIGDFFAGLGLGASIVIIMYGSFLKPYLYTNEINPDKQITSTASKQQFRCNVFKNGTLVGST